MKNYVKPSMNFVSLRQEEGIAGVGSHMSDEKNTEWVVLGGEDNGSGIKYHSFWPDC